MTPESPREAIEDTLRLIADELGDTRFKLVPGLILRRKSDDLTQTLRAQTNKYNRVGEQARFGLSAWLESAPLGKWMRDRYPDRPPSVSRFDRFVTARQLKFPGTPHHADWDVIDPSARSRVAVQAAEIFRSDVLPWLGRVNDPVGALSTLLDGGLHPSLVRYAVATGYSEAARLRISELLESAPALRETLERLRRDGKPGAFRDGLEPVAWAAIEAGVA